MATFSFSLSLSLSLVYDSTHSTLIPLLGFKEMRRVNFSCVSPASAAICTSIDRRSMVRASTRRAIDRHTPHLRDPRRAKSALSSVTRTTTEKKSHSQRRKSLDKPTNLISPPGSSRYLLNDDAFFDVFPIVDAAPPPLFSVERSQLEVMKKDVPAAVTTPSSAMPQIQVVHLRVSLHCKGCEGKVRKHISKMEGVTSFNIDFETKKVTVVGDVTPLGVLNSISKVKNAQLWPSPSSPPPPPPASS
ncbi:heavy metal-associated domain containing protein [Musa troglodytarum]|uniref:Heavy metal-associated domain containing protein n=1 Tax=Musa troglodytarum TaxID=320322 RepID=A0A9E7EZ36_9LILI|nr:heavy metal-associated domain containing protein [Musa troglodytarum]